MATRSETAAATRDALTAAAGTLLDAGGPEAVTLREVGARAGVSRSAPYRHFADKECLLTALAAESWRVVGDALEDLASDQDLAPSHALRQALLTFVAVGQGRPHLYRLMFTTPSGDPSTLVRAAGRTHELFLSIVARVVGAQHMLRYAALLLTSAHGIVGLESSGHLTWDKWHSTADDLVDTLIEMLPATS